MRGLGNMGLAVACCTPAATVSDLLAALAYVLCRRDAMSDDAVVPSTAVCMKWKDGFCIMLCMLSWCRPGTGGGLHEVADRRRGRLAPPWGGARAAAGGPGAADRDPGHLGHPGNFMLSCQQWV
jgi:hypothetical protein